MFLRQIYSLYLCWPKKMPVKKREGVRPVRVSSTLPRESIIRGGTLPPSIYTLQILVSNQLSKSLLLSDMILIHSHQPGVPLCRKWCVYVSSGAAKGNIWIRISTLILHVSIFYILKWKTLLLCNTCLLPLPEKNSFHSTIWKWVKIASSHILRAKVFCHDLPNLT